MQGWLCRSLSYSAAACYASAVSLITSYYIGRVPFALFCVLYCAVDWRISGCAKQPQVSACDGGQHALCYFSPCYGFPCRDVPVVSVVAVPVG